MKRPLRYVHGHTLIELVIAVALGLVVTAGAVSLYRTQRAALVRAGDSIQMREAGLTALTLVGQQLQMAGFFPADAPQSSRMAPLLRIRPDPRVAGLVADANRDRRRAHRAH